MIRRILKSQRGFTLIELLVAVGILAILAGVAVPVVVKFTGTSQTKAAAAEAANVQAAVDAMMADQGLGVLPDPDPGTGGALRTTALVATDDMSLFPYTTAGAYALAGGATGDYMRGDITNKTVGTYYVATDGTVTQASTGY